MADKDIETATSLDPFVAGGNPYLAGFKICIADGWTFQPGVCDPVPSGMQSVVFPQEISVGTGRPKTVQFAEVRSANPKEAINYIGNTKRSDKPVNIGNATDNNVRTGTKADAYPLFTDPIGNQDIGGAYHTIFPVQGSTSQCPPWAPVIGELGDVNKGVGGGKYGFLCRQKISDVWECCMGKKTGQYCRSDQAPRSTYCDAFMTRFCNDHQDRPECACMVKKKNPDPRLKKLGLPDDPMCSEPKCHRNPNTTYRSNTVMAAKCPPINICEIKTGDIQFAQDSYSNTVNLSCENAQSAAGAPTPAAGTPGTPAAAPPPAGAGGAPTPVTSLSQLLGVSNQQLLIGGGIMLVFFFLIILVAVAT